MQFSVFAGQIVHLTANHRVCAGRSRLLDPLAGDFAQLGEAHAKIGNCTIMCVGKLLDGENAMEAHDFHLFAGHGRPLRQRHSFADKFGADILGCFPAGIGIFEAALAEESVTIFRFQAMHHARFAVARDIHGDIFARDDHWPSMLVENARNGFRLGRKGCLRSPPLCWEGCAISNAGHDIKAARSVLIIHGGDSCSC